jgi:N-acetylglucosamine-6-sulfatase
MISAAARLFSAMLAIALLAATCDSSRPDISPSPGKRPSIVLILTDDQRWDTLWALPHVRALLVQHGVTFRNAFVVNAACCPSRVSILTGRYSHSTGVYTNSPPLGGYQRFHDDEQTVAAWLHDAGYRTALFGKYLNGYKTKRIPPGWDRWFAFEADPSMQYYLDYAVNDDGEISSYGVSPEDYSTDVLTDEAASFIQDTNGPLFLYFAPFAPHRPATPDVQDANAFGDLQPFRPPGYDEADVSDKPAWIRDIPRLTPEQTRTVDRVRVNQVRALQGIDRSVKRIVDALRETGRLDNTLIVFTSDNGLSWGEHRWPIRKETPYEQDIRVPFIVRYDPAGADQQYDKRFVLNIDLAPTFADVGGTAVPRTDGRSLIPLLSDDNVAWRNDFLIEHAFDSVPRHDPPSYCALRTRRYLYASYATGEEELYDLRADPYELQNLAGEATMRQTLEGLRVRTTSLCDPLPPGYGSQKLELGVGFEPTT